MARPNQYITIVDLNGYQSLARLLEGPATNDGDLTIRVYDYDGISNERVIHELTDAFLSNTWVKNLDLLAFEPDNMLYMLEWVSLLSALEKLTLHLRPEGFNPPTMEPAKLGRIAAFIDLLVVAQSPLQNLEWAVGHFRGDCMPLWNALQLNNTLQQVVFKCCKFDAANIIAFTNCFQNTDQILTVWGCYFQDSAFGRVAADIFVCETERETLKLCPSDYTYDWNVVDPVDEFEPLVEALKRQVDTRAALPKLELTMADAVMIRLLAGCLPNFTNLRDLSVNVSGPEPTLISMKALMDVLKQNGSLHSVHFSYRVDGRGDLTYGRAFQDAIGQRNQRVPELLRQVRKHEEHPDDANVHEVVAK